MNVSIKQFRAFLALYEHHSFTRAAAAVCLSQSAFSGLITALETETGLRLFDRDTHRVRPTPEGEEFVHIARRMAGLYDASTKEIAALARGERGRACIAALPSVAVSWLPAALADYRLRYPRVRVELIDALSDRCLQALADGIADFAIAAPRELPPGMEAVTLCQESFHLVCRRDHPLGALECACLADLEQATVFVFANTTSIGQYLARGLPASVRRDTLQVEQLTTMMGLVAAGIGVSIVPDLALYQFRHPDIRIVALSDFPLKREIQLITRTDCTTSTASVRLRAAILANLYDG